MGMSKAEAEDKVLTQNSGFWKFSCQVLYFWYSTWHSAIPFFFSPHCKMDILLLFWSEAEFFFLLSSIFSMLVSFMRGIAELYNDIVVVFFFFFFLIMHISICLQYVKSFSITVLGHSRSGEIQNNYHSLLPGCNGLHFNVWHHEWRVFQCCAGLVSKTWISY